MKTSDLEHISKHIRTLTSTLEPRLDRLLSYAWASYVLIAALQLKVIWHIWKFRDLTTGDTSSYFSNAAKWADHFGVNIVWSPLYTAFYGTIFYLTQDAYSATIAHRVIIVLAATLGVLALMRSILPPSIALLVAAWWAVMPINFETLYEVHLFALLPVLAAWLVTTRNDSPWTRGIALAILLATTFLVRNEMIIAVVLFSLVCFLRDALTIRDVNSEMRPSIVSRLTPYVFPALVSMSVVAAFYALSEIRYSQISSAIDSKHGLNMCQVYAFGYGQRHPEWTASPWVECSPLMVATFGKSWPSLREMISSNPYAVLQHVLWNVSLTLNGLQVGLFNAMSGTVNPDYAPVRRSTGALYLTLLAGAIVIAGAWKAIANWNDEWREWFSRRQGTWLIMLSVACVTVPVIMTQRPRPSYLFSLTAVLMAVVATGATVVLGRRWLVVAKALAVAGVPLLILVVPSYYAKHRSDRPLHVNLERLLPHRTLLANTQNTILFGDYNGEFRGYLRLKSSVGKTYDYSLLKSWKPPESLDEFLDARGINVIFVQPRIMPELRARSGAKRLLDQPESLGWRKVAPSGTGNWLLLYRPPRVGSPAKV